MRKMLFRGRLLTVLALASFVGVTAAHAAGTMVALSSAVYDSGSSDTGRAVVVDRSGDVIALGRQNFRAFITIKYDSNMNVISSAAYNCGMMNCYPFCAAVDSHNNIFVAGSVDGWGHLTLKYDTNLNFISSATASGTSGDAVCGMAIDGSDNVIVTGYLTESSKQVYCTIKYDNNLNIISSATYSGGGGADYAQAVAIDSAGNIIVTGQSQNNCFTIKYDSNLNVISSTTYDSGGEDGGAGVAVDGSGNIIVAGYHKPTGLSKYLTIKYDNNLNVISSATYGGPTNDMPYGIAVDGLNNIIVTGSCGSGVLKRCTIKYDSNLTVISSAVYSGTTDDETFGVAVDGSNNIFVTGSINLHDMLTMKFRGSPAITSVSPAIGVQGQTLDVAVTGANFGPGAAVMFSGFGITVNTVTYNNAASLTANITVSSNAATGKRNITVTNTDSDAGTKAGAFTVLTGTSGTSVAITPASAGEMKLYPASGVEITLDFPAGTFGSAVTMTAKAATAPTGSPCVKLGNICFEITNDLSLQPLKDVTVTIKYNDADIAGIDEAKLKLCRYDNGKWIEMPSVVDTVNNTITATLNHFSTFALAQVLAATDLSNVKVYPNPFNPKNDTQGLAIANLTAEATLKIYNVAGELIAKPEYSGGGIARWYGKNDGGSSVASGVYLLFIDSAQGKKKLKIAVEK